MNELAVKNFAFNDADFTLIIDGDGKFWFIASEVCNALGYVHAGHAIKKHCKHAKILKRTETVLLEIPPRGILIIPEGDLYRLTARSKLPAAEKFEEKVFDEILPEIRETGGYGNKRLAQQQTELSRLEILQIALKAEKEKLALLDENEELKTINGNSRNWKQVKAIPWLKDYFNLKNGPGVYTAIGRYLSKFSLYMGVDIIKIEDSKYGHVNAYHRSILDAFKRSLEVDKTLLRDYRYR
jgi:prophage antirepressor-like protein